MFLASRTRLTSQADSKAPIVPRLEIDNLLENNFTFMRIEARDHPAKRDVDIAHPVDVDAKRVGGARVLTDPGSAQPVLYTENLFVKFHEGVRSSAAKKAMKAAGLTVRYEVGSSTIKMTYFGRPTIEAPADGSYTAFALPEDIERLVTAAARNDP